MKWFLFFSFLIISGCFCSAGINRTDSEPFLDMIQQKTIKPQEGTKKGALQMRLPPEGTMARNRNYYPYQNDPLKAATKLKNPLLPISPEIIKQGKAYYEKFCIYCHGANGDSLEGATVAPKMLVKPPSLLTQKARGYSDGRIYHIIYSGQGLMGPYRIQLETKDQVLGNYLTNEKNVYQGFESIWAVVNYVRMLQKLAKKEGQNE